VTNCLGAADEGQMLYMVLEDFQRQTEAVYGWKDLVKFEAVPVLTSPQAAELIAPRL
jgi:hypothetical protein